jgi:hypothetical protein
MAMRRRAAIECDVCAETATLDVDLGKDAARKSKQRAKAEGFTQVYRHGKQLDLCPRCTQHPPPAHDRHVAVGHIAPSADHTGASDSFTWAEHHVDYGGTYGG